MKKSEKYIIVGAGGQVGKELCRLFPHANAVTREGLDIADAKQVNEFDWSPYTTIINAAAYVNADHSETPEGRDKTWRANAIGPKNLAEVAIRHNMHLIHFSSEYVFDGTTENHKEDEVFSPLSVYGQSKAAADLAVSLVPKHHILRTTWVVGDGHNFIKTMKNLADMRINPKVVHDQFGRLTFVSELGRAVKHILEQGVHFGTYNLSNAGKVCSWAELAAMTFELAGHDKSRVHFISTDEYKKEKAPFAPRPTYSDLDLTKIQLTGFQSEDYEPLLKGYIDSLEAAV